MKYLVQIARVLIGITFIYSGYVKLVDPIGSAIKLTEYFSEDVLNLPFFEPYVLPLSILLIVAELLLGVMVLIGYKPKLSVYAVSLLMFVFLFLTWYSAYFDKVNDCGCFGDAIKISPWATFYKNVFFSALILILIFGLKHIKPWFSKSVTNLAPFIVLFGSLYLSYYVLQHLPIHDFRPFAIGKSITEGMQDVEGEDFPPIHDFILETPEGEDLTDTVLNTEKVLLVISYNLTYSDEASFIEIQELTDKALEQGYRVYMLTASFVDEFEDIKQAYEFNFDMLYCDETTLKTMIRSNPGIMVLENGVVTGKWNWKDIDKINLN